MQEERQQPQLNEESISKIAVQEVRQQPNKPVKETAAKEAEQQAIKPAAEIPEQQGAQLQGKNTSEQPWMLDSGDVLDFAALGLTRHNKGVVTQDKSCSAFASTLVELHACLFQDTPL